MGQQMGETVQLDYVFMSHDLGLESLDKKQKNKNMSQAYSGNAGLCDFCWGIKWTETVQLEYMLKLTNI